jgi:hypothetical protein
MYLHVDELPTCPIAYVWGELPTPPTADSPTLSIAPIDLTEPSRTVANLFLILRRPGPHQET